MSETVIHARDWISTVSGGRFSFAELAACADRELHSRKSRYVGYVARHRMSAQKAADEIEMMAAIGEVMRALAKTEVLL